MTEAPVRFDVGARVLALGERRVRLNPQEALIVEALVAADGASISCQRLGLLLDPEGTSGVPTRICVVRRRMRAAGFSALIETRHGAGYGIDPGTVVLVVPQLMLTTEGARLVRRLIECCPHPDLAERARSVVFGGAAGNP